ncbi:MAG: hypothetical protein ACP5N3_05245 [Candidatus Nanoarchaeia archaeon]
MNPKKSKPTLIFVPGIVSKKSLPKVLDKVYSLVSGPRGYENWMNEFSKTLDYSCIVFKWSRKFKNIDEDAAKLKKLVEKQDEVILFGKSMGCEIIKKALPSKKVRKVILIAMPYNRIEVKAKRIINVYSKSDVLTNVSMLKSKKIKNAENIEIKGFMHDDFNRNHKFKINGKEKELYDFYRELIKKR